MTTVRIVMEPSDSWRAVVAVVVVAAAVSGCPVFPVLAEQAEQRHFEEHTDEVVFVRSWVVGFGLD